MTSWVRLWTDMPTDPKWRVIARKSGRPVTEVMAVFILMMTNVGENASERNERVRERGELNNWSHEDAGAAIDVEPEHVEAIFAAMQGKVLDGDKLIGWEKRQPKREDGASERAKAWRERKRTQANAAKRSDSDSDTDIESVQSTEQEPARNEPAPKKAEQILDIGSKVKLGARALPSFKPTALDRLKVQAEKFGLDVDDLSEKTAKRNATNPAGYFITLAVNQLKSKTPLVDEKVLTAAMRGESLAVSAVFQALSEPAQ